MRRLVVLAFALAGPLWFSPQAGAATAFSVRGITLGILLADFKIMPAPDHERWPDSRPVCTDDAPSAPLSAAAAKLILPGEADARAGIVRCAYLQPQGGMLAPAGLLIAGFPIETSFIFVADHQGEMRLAGVKAEGDSASYDRIKSALLKRYGLPQTVVRGFAYDATGTKLLDEMARWNNGVSEIVIDQRLENKDVTRMGIEYRHDALIEEAEKRLRAGSGGADLL